MLHASSSVGLFIDARCDTNDEADFLVLKPNAELESINVRAQAIALRSGPDHLQTYCYP